MRARSKFELKDLQNHINEQGPNEHVGFRDLVGVDIGPVSKKNLAVNKLLIKDYVPNWLHFYDIVRSCHFDLSKVPVYLDINVFLILVAVSSSCKN